MKHDQKTEFADENLGNFALKVDGLHAGYGAIPILQGLNLEVEHGQIVGVLGHNGMGKTTLMKTLMGLVSSTSGQIFFNDHDFTHVAAHARASAGIGYVPQGRGIIATITAEENLRLAWFKDSGLSEEDALDSVLELFPRLKRLLDRKGGSLSGGEQQLLALARSLIPEPWILLLDEPTEGIQPNIIEEMAETLVHLKTRKDLTVLLVEQNMDFMLSCAQRVLVLEKGCFVGDLNEQQLQSHMGLAELMGMGAGRIISQKSAPRTTAIKTNPTRLDAVEPAKQARQNPIAIEQHHEGKYMSIRRPTTEQMREVISSLHMTMSESETQEYMALMEGSFQAYDRIDALPDNIPEVAYPRTPGSRPAAQDNPMNAWYVKTDVKGANSGPLQGKKIVLKDNVSLAGVLMMNGASTLEGYVPDMDATVVRRILDAGGTIVGKAHCEYFCLSGGSHTNATGPVHNPWRMGYIAGGSSSGCGALVGAGEIEMAIGGDQGGSIRIPSAFCGAYGMKPTHGLVPYTGIMPIEATIDHAGPITTTVADNALLLEVIAGADGLDPRQYSPRVDKYTSALGRGINGLRIGVVREGFELPNMESDVANKVRQAVDRLVKLGAIAEEISIPMHLDGAAIWTPIALEGLQAQMMHGNGMGFNWEGLYSTSLMDRHASWRNRANELSPTLKISMFVGEYALRQYGGRFYAKAQNLSRLLRSKYDEALNQYDLLLMPTLPIKAKPIPAPGAALSEVIERAFEMIGNTAPFDASGHPAMSVPVGLCDGLPVGMMLVGKHWGESTIYRAAHAFEQSGDWKSF